MSVIRYLVIIIFLFLLVLQIPQIVFAEDHEGTDLQVFISMDKFSYSDLEPVILNIYIKNLSNKNKVLKIYDSIYTTFHPVVYDKMGREAEIIVPYRLMNKKMVDTIKDITPRTITLVHSETLKHTINLRDIYKLKVDNEYRVDAGFSPDVKFAGRISSDNVILFNIFKTTDLIKYSGIKRIGRDISPSEVVLLFLHAEKNNKWDNYLKYLNLDEFITAYPKYVKIYKNADDIRKTIIIEEFINFLKRKRSDYIIDFEIVNEIKKGKTTAFVDAEVKRYGTGLPFYYKYRYSLERFRSFWRITDVEASVIRGHKS